MNNIKHLVVHKKNERISEIWDKKFKNSKQTCVIKFWFISEIWITQLKQESN